MFSLSNPLHNCNNPIKPRSLICSNILIITNTKIEGSCLHELWWPKVIQSNASIRIKLLHVESALYLTSKDLIGLSEVRFNVSLYGMYSDLCNNKIKIPKQIKDLISIRLYMFHTERSTSFVFIGMHATDTYKYES